MEHYQLLSELGTPLFRYHGDIDFMVAEKDIEKVREALDGTDYVFFDDRLDNKKWFNENAGYIQGEHEVIANHKNNEFHLGFFLFRREPDGSMTKRRYFMKENKDGTKVPMVLEEKIPRELVEFEFSTEETEFAGTKFRTSSPESVYDIKMFTKNKKDMLDIEALKDKVDKRKIAESKKYKKTLRVVEADMERTIEKNDVLSSAIEATERTTRIETINQQAENIRKVEQSKTIAKEIKNIGE